MNIFLASLNPCNTRKVNVKQYLDFMESCGHSVVESPALADIIFVWGCEFRNDWREFTHSVVKDLKEQYKKEIIYIGCTFVDEHTKKTASELGVTIIPWKDDKHILETKIQEVEKKLSQTPLRLTEKQIVEDLKDYREKNPTARVWFEDEYIKLNICEGCRGYCTYCSERMMFPEFRSFDEDKIINDCKKALQESKTKRILFLADSSGDYGKDTNTSLTKLIKRLKNEVDSEIKIGITQINPEHFLEQKELLNFVADGTIDYLNLPIQTASDVLLERMNRKYRYKDIKDLFDKLSDLKFSNFSTHLLLGFPGETMSDVEKSVDFLSHYKIRHVVASSFMSHPAIKASQFSDQILPEEKRKRVMFCKERLTSKGIIVFTDFASISNKLMIKIKESLGLSRNIFQKD